ncbi:hypothetical protein Q5716_00550 [Protaetiibacter sp. WY-16]|uniref:Uncharacterized protein n=1 Tax=Antiquaquibacter soli TaxID=3064523 RepID=A0ABT9BI77_9MICO|nr:hypothetical protein [Protaetiibacter sp. WY-16]
MRGDELADVTFDGSLVLRAVRAVIRDRDWNTVPTTVVSAELGDPLSLSLRFDGFGAEFDGTLSVTAEGDILTVSFSATAHRDFLRNRIGLVALHPPTLAGHPLAITHPDGTTTLAEYPDTIAPHQPARDIAALAWSAGGLDIAARFTGDTFEMEDQRNWTDASFKTYSTPLDVPFPVLVPAGTEISQSLELSVSRVAPAAIQDDPAIVFTRTDALVPEVSAGSAVEHLVVGAPTEVAPAVAALPPRTRRVAVFDAATHITEPALWDALVAAAAGRFELVGGTRAHFTELNRTHERLPADLPALTFSITPQMHARENAQLVESIGMQRLVVRDARAIAAGRPLHVGPVTLRPRFNAVATSGVVEPAPADERQSSPALAAWTIASAAALFQPGVASVSWFEESGPKGVAGFPVEEAIRWLRELAGHPLFIAEDLPRDVWAVAAELPTGPVALVANLRDEPVTVRLGTPFDRGVSIPPLTALRLG